ncbi:MAG TPA: LD-carboxypeptidase [Thermoanaerobaculia bacterium]|nr:LD-carboxypeptidase [Thermoanaerobaculia bacterium]
MRGATIGVAALSGPVEEERLETGIARLEGRGFGVRKASNVLARAGFLAGADEQRAVEYRKLLRDSSVDAIFFARGGYGVSRVLSLLDAKEVAANPKVHLGGSDLTVLHAWIQRHAGLATFYGPMVAVEMAGEKEAELDWETVLRGDPIPAHDIASEDVLAPGDAEGPLVGGCLSLLASMCGTPEQVDARGSILFWEDVDEDTYRLDRMLTQLERAGTLDGLKGMVIGSVVPRRDGESRETVRDYLRERFRGSPFPVAMGIQAGHLKNSRTLPLGAHARLDLGTGRLTLEGPVVR